MDEARWGENDLTCEVDDEEYIKGKLRWWMRYGSPNSNYWVRESHRSTRGGIVFYTLSVFPKGTEPPLENNKAHKATWLTGEEFLRKHMKVRRVG